MELTYRTEGDYQLPNLDVPEAPKVGKYGMLRRSYLQKYRNGYYTGMQLSGRLNAHLEKIDREATEMVERLTARMAREQGVTEELKASDQMKWVGLLSLIQSNRFRNGQTTLISFRHGHKARIRPRLTGRRGAFFDSEGYLPSVPGTPNATDMTAFALRIGAVSGATRDA